MLTITCDEVLGFCGYLNDMLVAINCMSSFEVEEEVEFMIDWCTYCL